jgi:hypothetical protein
MNIDKFKKIENYGAIRSHINCIWTDEDFLNFTWVETIQTKEVPKDDPWESFTTSMKYQLEELHQSWNIPDNSTWHLMAHKPELTERLRSVLDNFKQKTISYNFIKITPGHMLVWHYDTYATFVNRNDLTFEDSENIKRSAVLMNDWDIGQVIQVGNDVIAHWKAGDVITWDSFAWHGTANFGKSDMVVMQVSYIDE